MELHLLSANIVTYNNVEFLAELCRNYEIETSKTKSTIINHCNF